MLEIPNIMNKPIIALLFAILSFSSYAQGVNSDFVDVNKDVDVTIVYEQVVKEGYGTPFIYKELANAYYFKNEHSKAKTWYEKLFETEKSDDETLTFRYHQTLKALKVENSKKGLLSSFEAPD